ncbi:MAG TPA: hypothetical protein VJT49_10735 [Amycolatopsis sp.]|uniref:hypothetical protein n=1 Tax=Amycolatopsis sp. TaxID=37632 RepID=UPI002B49ADE1|nr:hypothetical protein [Amycolatopsis sp.]HKS45567.1 hypothetical protein [Amycolatopsis sp.]
MIENDPDSLEHVAGQVEKIHDHFQDSKAKMTGIVGENPFGAIKHPDERPGEHPSDGVANTLGSYRDGMHKQFDAASRLMLSAGGVLRDAARAMRETDAAAADSLTVKDGSPRV